MYTNKLEALARATSNEDFPFSDMQTWMIEKNDDGTCAITDNGESTDFASVEELVNNFPHIAIEDLTIEFDNDDEKINQAIEDALRKYGIS